MKFTQENTKGDKNPFFGRKHSEETKAKIGVKSLGRKHNLGKIRSEETRKKISIANIGKTHVVSEESKKKMSISMRGIKKPTLYQNKNAQGHIPWNRGKPEETSGIKNPNWKGGISYKIACKVTLERDNYTCQICGIADPDVLEVDHRLCRAIRPDLQQDLSNLWTLCANCHKRKTKRDWVEIRKHRLSATE